MELIEISPNRFNRFEVLSVENHNSLRKLRMKHLSSGGIYLCDLSGSWLHSSRVSKGNIVHVRSEVFSDDTYTVDDQHGLITIDPDNLITSTLLSMSLPCVRRAWLIGTFRMTNPIGHNTQNTNEPMLIGTMVHKIFQTACTHRSATMEDLKKIKEMCFRGRNIISECLLANVHKEQLEEKVDAYLPNILYSIKEFLDEPKLIPESRSKVKVETIKDIEDNMWAPSLGIRGKADITCEVTIHPQSPNKVRVPLELKTGKKSSPNQHMAQVSLYSMMMKERESDQCESGLLLDLEGEPRMSVVSVKQPETKDLLNRRNELAYFLSQNKTILSGPELADSKGKYPCDGCDQIFTCGLMAKSFRPELLETSNSPSKTEKLIFSNIKHLKPEEINFFKKWMSLITLESEEAEKEQVAPFWSENSPKRESKKIGLGSLIIKEVSDKMITLRRSPQSSSRSLFTSFPGLLGERVALSEDELCDTVPKKVALSVGWVSKLEPFEIHVAIEGEARDLDKDVTYRIDQWKSSDLSPLIYRNLLTLMTEETPAKILRNIIIHQHVERVCDPLSDKSNLAILETRHLNMDQQGPIFRLETMEHYLLIRGTPGSGKTKTVVAMVKHLLRLKKSILITSHTHAAVDNILCKLDESEVDFVRFGRNSRIHPRILKYSVKHKTENITTTMDLNRFYQEIKVAGVTCLGVSSDPFLAKRRFDFCIVDEASQILLPTVLGPLFISDRFILVGDENQLPPLVRSKKARDGGLGQSLFSLLLEKLQPIDPPILFSFPLQYRMNRDIMSYPSRLYYQNTLKYASEKIANAVIPRASSPTGLRWLDSAISNDMSRSFLFLDTDHIKDWESDDSGTVTNRMEVKICNRMVNEFTIRNGISSSEIGIISPFRAQVSLLREEIEDGNILISTIDQFQGEERNVIMISLVKRQVPHNRALSPNEILSDGCRLNVALTRAAQKLVLIGSRSNLNRYELTFRRLFDMMSEDKFIRVDTLIHEFGDFECDQDA